MEFNEALETMKKVYACFSVEVGEAPCDMECSKCWRYVENDQMLNAINIAIETMEDQLI